MATDNNSVSIGYLSDIQMNLTEMKREYNKLEELGEQVSSAVEELASAINALAALVECDVQVDPSITKSISFSTTAIMTDMQYQMNTFIELNELTSEELSAVEGYLEFLKGKGFKGHNGLSFQTNLSLRREVANILDGISSGTVVSNVLGEDVNLFTYDWSNAELLDTDLYTYLTENCQEKLAKLGLTGSDAGKKYVETMIAIAKNNSETNRDKTVNSVIILESICASQNVRLRYGSTNGVSYVDENNVEHRYNVLDEIVNHSDCSDFVSWALNQGGDCEALYTGNLSRLSSGTVDDYSEIKPGDILLYHHNDDDAHVVIVLENTGEGLVIAHSGTPSEGNYVVYKTYDEVVETWGSDMKGYDMDEYYND